MNELGAGRGTVIGLAIEAQLAGAIGMFICQKLQNKYRWSTKKVRALRRARAKRVNA